MASVREGSEQNNEKGHPSWFHTEKGLNNYGYRPGAPQDDIDALPNNVVDEAKCATRWGARRHGSFWYAKPGRSESPRMCYRVEKLYQITHQRPMGKQKCFGVAFGRGLMAEKLGYAVDWAWYAGRHCSNGKKSFETLEEYKAKSVANNSWRRNNEVRNMNEDEESLRGAPDDWEINRQPKLMDMSQIQKYNLKALLIPTPTDTVSLPLYGREVEGHGRHETYAP